MQALHYISTIKARLVLVCAALCISVGALLVMTVPAGAINTGNACDSPQMAASAVCRGKSENVGGTFGANIVNTMLFALGIVAVIMIIIGGIKYTTADGDASKLTSAKNTILYSIVGLIVAIMAWGIVTFVVNQVR